MPLSSRLVQATVAIIKPLLITLTVPWPKGPHGTTVYMWERGHCRKFRNTQLNSAVIIKSTHSIRYLQCIWSCAVRTSVPYGGTLQGVHQNLTNLLVIVVVIVICVRDHL